MNKTITALQAAFLALCLLPVVSFATHDDEDALAILAELEANRRAVVAENLHLQDTNAQAFWGVYDAYRAEIAELEQQGFKLLREFRDHFEEITDERANQVMASYFSLEIQTLEVRRKYVSNFNEVIPARQTLRFYQIENKLDSIIEADISSVTPLVPE